MYTKENPYVPQEKFHLSLGNVKIGKILNTNLQAGDDYIRGRTTVQGSCVGCCDTCVDDCYARSQYRYANTIAANGDNTYYARENMMGYFHDMVEELNKHPSFKLHRFHSSGEIISPDYLDYVCKVADLVRDKKHYIYTKRYEWVNEYTKEYGRPDNLAILFSPPFICATLDEIKVWNKINNPYDYPLFIYDKGKDKQISDMPHCPAVNKEGHKTGVTCDKCQRCPNGLTTAVYAH